MLPKGFILVYLNLTWCFNRYLIVCTLQLNEGYTSVTIDSYDSKRNTVRRWKGPLTFTFSTMVVLTVWTVPEDFPLLVWPTAAGCSSVGMLLNSFPCRAFCNVSYKAGSVNCIGVHVCSVNKEWLNLESVLFLENRRAKKIVWRIVPWPLMRKHKSFFQR